ncbi:cyclin-dependent kinase-like protein [Wolffia australiana]
MGSSPAGLRDSPAGRRGGATPSVRSTTGKSGICGGEGGHVVSLSKCRPSAREKISVVPLDNVGRSRPFFPWRSPRLSPSPAGKDEDWRRAAADLSQKLALANRTRDDAMTEAARLKSSMAELEKKLARLETHCAELKSAVQGWSPAVVRPVPVELFVRTVEEAGGAVRRLSGALLALTGQADAGLLVAVEALLSRTFYEDFERSGFEPGSGDRTLDPVKRTDENLATHATFRKLTWDDVLSRGTRHYSEAFSRFCDRKMSDVAGAGGGTWGRRGWPEPLLQAFFATAKAVYLVHLLAWSGHPPAVIFRVDAAAPFDPQFMVDVGGGGGEVKMMMSPGFFFGSSVVKCRVILRRRQRRERTS